MSLRSRLCRPALAALALIVLAGGCGSADDHAAPTAAADRRDEQQAATPAPTASPSDSAAPSPSASPAASPSHRQHPKRRLIAPYAIGQRGNPLIAHLLDAARVPALDVGAEGDHGWVLAATGPEDSATVGDCQQASLVSIGAVRAVRRTYTPAGDLRGAEAVQVVAVFADRRSAHRAQAVLRSWHEDCEAEVGPLRTVAIETGDGERYRSRVPATEHRRKRTADLGILVRGTYVSLVEISAPTRAFPERRHPARPAVRRIARTFDS